VKFNIFIFHWWICLHFTCGQFSCLASQLLNQALEMLLQPTTLCSSNSGVVAMVGCSRNIVVVYRGWWVSTAETKYPDVDAADSTESSTGFPLVLKSPEIGHGCWKSHEKVLIFASVIPKNQDTESVIFSSNICLNYWNCLCISHKLNYLLFSYTTCCLWWL